LFGRDLAFFVFVLPFWRLVHGWAITLVTGTIVLTLVVYVLQRSLVLTTRGPRLAAGARTHLLVLGALVLALKGIGFWLDRFELVFSPRGIVFGASYTDTYASLPALGVLAVLSAVAAVLCLAQIATAGLPLLRTFAQLQEIRTYYEFIDVDVGRYTLNGDYKQLMLSARELSYPHLQSRIWINEHLTFTHGYGVVVGPVNRITPEGLPEFV